ncbi:hypothetical protein CKAH01_12082 [Colletotrichum kahawae]|uniref:Uncharacterized protein n=1 Tax=Colletotrichum kahawae TaxID=34407 RepID=A0AAD9YV75_COLKA|nr:hypothetical protein CKAH01_12082 [Colletotrichum kahawae]
MLKNLFIYVLNTLLLTIKYLKKLY